MEMLLEEFVFVDNNLLENSLLENSVLEMLVDLSNLNNVVV